MESSSYRTASDTLALLEERLRRVQYLIHGDTDPLTRPEPTEGASIHSRPTASATQRLRKLERNLASLADKSSAVSDVLTLQSRHPHLFNHSSDTRNLEPALPPASLAALVTAHTDLFTTTSSSLQHLSAQPGIPDPAAFAKLVALQPRISRALAKQDAQSREVAELRRRSARVVERWYEEGVLGMAERWAGWEERLREGEVLVRRREARERREREGLV